MWRSGWCVQRAPTTCASTVCAAARVCLCDQQSLWPEGSSLKRRLSLGDELDDTLHREEHHAGRLQRVDCWVVLEVRLDAHQPRVPYPFTQARATTRLAHHIDTQGTKIFPFGR